MRFQEGSRRRSAERGFAVLAAVVLGGIGCGSRSNLRSLMEDAEAIPSNSAGGSSSGSGTGGSFGPGAGGGAIPGAGGLPEGSGGAPLSCEGDEVRCGLECANLAEDQAHCGACDSSCGQDEICIAAACECVAFSRRLITVTPENGQSSVEEGTDVTARFNCSVDALSVSSESARLYGSLSGWILSDFPEPELPFDVTLRPRPRPGRKRALFPGEMVTAWLGETLGGPHLWQFRGAVNSASPGKFSPAMSLPPATSKYVYASALGDTDGDGDLDLWTGSSDELRFFENQGSGTFSDPVVFSYPAWNITFGDVENDGILEVAVTDFLGGTTEPQGHLFVRQGEAYVARADTSACTAFGDLNGDGFLDCLSTGHYGVVDGKNETDGKVLFNDGFGNFVEGTTAEFGFWCELGDLNNDGSLDAACVSPVVAPAYVLLNDGKGSFTRTDQELGEVGAREIGLGDVDADGDLDLLVSHWFGGGKSAQNVVFRNDGHAHFESSTSFGKDGGDFELGDVDGDGDLDVLVSILPTHTTSPAAAAHPIAIYQNDGKGSFQKGTGTLGSPAFHRISLGDFDGDQDLDAVIHHRIGESYWTEAWLNEE